MKLRSKGKMEDQYPECEKMAAVKDEFQVIGEFLEWLQHDRQIQVKLCVLNSATDKSTDYYTKLVPYRIEMEQLLAEFFGIDLDKVEQEKRWMFKEIREKGD